MIFLMQKDYYANYNFKCKTCGKGRREKGEGAAKKNKSWYTFTI